MTSIPHLETESAIQSRCMSSLVLRVPGARFWRANVDLRGAHKKGFVGMPDILGVQADGKFLAVEVKKHDGKLSQEQYDFLLDIHRRGGLAAVYAPLVAGGLEELWPIDKLPQRFTPKAKK